MAMVAAVTVLVGGALIVGVGDMVVVAVVAHLCGALGHWHNHPQASLLHCALHPVYSPPPTALPAVAAHRPPQPWSPEALRTGVHTSNKAVLVQQMRLGLLTRSRLGPAAAEH